MLAVAEALEIVLSLCRPLPAREVPLTTAALGSVLAESVASDLDMAIAGCRRAVELEPDFVEAFAQLVMLNMQACDWRTAEEDERRILSLMRQYPGRISPANLLCQTSTAAEQFQCARDWVRKLKTGSRRELRHSHPTSRARLRLGATMAPAPASGRPVVP